MFRVTRMEKYCCRQKICLVCRCWYQTTRRQEKHSASRQWLPMPSTVAQLFDTSSAARPSSCPQVSFHLQSLVMSIFHRLISISSLFTGTAASYLIERQHAPTFFHCNRRAGVPRVRSCCHLRQGHASSALFFWSRR